MPPRRQGLVMTSSLVDHPIDPPQAANKLKLDGRVSASSRASAALSVTRRKTRCRRCRRTLGGACAGPLVMTREGERRMAPFCTCIDSGGYIKLTERWGEKYPQVMSQELLKKTDESNKNERGNDMRYTDPKQRKIRPQVKLEKVKTSSIK